MLSSADNELISRVGPGRPLVRLMREYRLRFLMSADLPAGGSLFFGRIEEGGLRCVYHGWKFDPSGTCVDMPNEPTESNLKTKVQYVVYPCQERNGIIWTDMGPANPAPALPELEWSLVPESLGYVSKRVADCDWLQSLEGAVEAFREDLPRTARRVPEPPSAVHAHPQDSPAPG